MRVEVRGVQHIWGILALRQNAAPQVQREIWVHSAQNRNKVTLESVNAIFGWVGAVIVGWHKLQSVFVLMNDDVLQFLWTFIIHFVDGRA